MYREIKQLDYICHWWFDVWVNGEHGIFETTRKISAGKTVVIVYQLKKNMDIEFVNRTERKKAKTLDEVSSIISSQDGITLMVFALSYLFYYWVNDIALVSLFSLEEAPHLGV